MDKLSDLLGRRLNQHRLGDSARAAAILSAANKLLQAKLECQDDEVRAFRLDQGVLYVGTSNSVWGQEVWARQEELMAEIHQEYGKNSLSKIVIKGLTMR